MNVNDYVLSGVRDSHLSQEDRVVLSRQADQGDQMDRFHQVNHEFQEVQMDPEVLNFLVVLDAPNFHNDTVINSQSQRSSSLDLRHDW